MYRHNSLFAVNDYVADNRQISLN